MRTLRERFEEKVAKIPFRECWEWLGGPSGTGYGKLRPGREMPGSPPEEMAHRIAWFLANGPIPDGLWVLHRCDNRSCVNPEHLFIGTRRDNVDDMVAKGRNNFGEHTPGCKLRAEDITEICRLRRSGLSQRMAAQMFGVSQSQISRITTGKQWVRVTGGDSV